MVLWRTFLFCNIICGKVTLSSNRTRAFIGKGSSWTSDDQSTTNYRAQLTWDRWATKALLQRREILVILLLRAAKNETLHHILYLGLIEILTSSTELSVGWIKISIFKNIVKSTWDLVTTTHLQLQCYWKVFLLVKVKDFWKFPHFLSLIEGVSWFYLSFQVLDFFKPEQKPLKVVVLLLLFFVALTQVLRLICLRVRIRICSF